jgi:hypothetical protein
LVPHKISSLSHYVDCFLYFHRESRETPERCVSQGCSWGGQLFGQRSVALSKEHLLVHDVLAAVSYVPDQTNLLPKALRFEQCMCEPSLSSVSVCELPNCERVGVMLCKSTILDNEEPPSEVWVGGFPHELQGYDSGTQYP